MAEVTPARATAVARAGAAHLAELVGADGRFRYSYALNDPSFVNPAYSTVRHIGAVWALAGFVRAGSDIPGLGEAMNRAATYVEQHIFRPFGGTGALCVYDEGFIKLAGSALGVTAEAALLGLADPGAADARRDRISRLARHVASQREADGDFLPARIPGPIARPYPARDDLTPGQGVLALALAAEATGERTFLDLAVNSADRFAARDSLVGRTGHWMLYAIEALDRQAPSDARLAYARRIVDAGKAIAMSDDGMGRACMTEGLLAMARTLSARGENETEVAGLLARVAANLQRQVRLFHPSGAFLMSATRQEVRIDSIMHNVLGFAGYARMIQG